MCKRRTMQATVAAQPYEGKTIRFDAERRLEQEARTSSHCGFPWWTLWLIWPLIGFLKWAAPLMLGVVAAIGEITVPLIPLLLIGLGLYLLRRR